MRNVRCDGYMILGCDKRCEKGDNMAKSNIMGKPGCYGTYDYDHTCLRCECGSKCLDYTRDREEEDIQVRDTQMKKYKDNETKEGRTKRLDEEWYKKLPCHTCHPKMQKLCKYYNSFKRPDYNNEQFKIGDILCDDKIPAGDALKNPFKYNSIPQEAPAEYRSNV